jgi:hypothetical protein
MFEVYDKKNNTWPFPYWPWYHPMTHISPRLRLGLIWESRDDTRANMEKVMYYSLYNHCRWRSRSRVEDWDVIKRLYFRHILVSFRSHNLDCQRHMSWSVFVFSELNTTLSEQIHNPASKSSKQRRNIFPNILWYISMIAHSHLNGTGTNWYDNNSQMYVIYLLWKQEFLTI